jgi:hypothetical protein
MAVRLSALRTGRPLLIYICQYIQIMQLLSPWKLTDRFSQRWLCLLLGSHWFLTCLILQPWKCRQYSLPKLRLTFNGIHGVISQKVELFTDKYSRVNRSTYLYEACSIWNSYIHSVSLPNNTPKLISWSFIITNIKLKYNILPVMSVFYYLNTNNLGYNRSYTTLKTTAQKQTAPPQKSARSQHELGVALNA